MQWHYHCPSAESSGGVILNIIMAGLDHEHADIALREQLSFVAGQVSGLLQKIRATPQVCGCVLLSTCNRTELYLSLEIGSAIQPAALLCQVAGVPQGLFTFVTRKHAQAEQHLMEVACGLKSQILGEDQIVTQVKNAVKLAREMQTTDAILETLFRYAITAGKEVKTETKLTAVSLSAAHRGVEVATHIFDNLADKRAVVIGNGEMGRLAATLLIEQGAQVTVTLRSYRHGETIVPRGCKTHPYENRVEVIDGADLVLSATTSPHFTLTRAQIAQMHQKPKLLVDLALPRDIEPTASTLTSVYNMDDLGHFSCADEAQQKKALQIIDKYREKLAQWTAYRAALPLIEQIKQEVFARTYTQDIDEDALRLAVEKTVDMLLLGMKEVVTTSVLQSMLEHVQKYGIVAEKTGSEV